MFLKKILFIFILTFFISSCAAVSEKAAKKADKENAYLSTFLSKPSFNLSHTFGKPMQILTENNQTIHLYEIKCKMCDCQRKFTIDNKNIETGFVSTCWD